MDRHSPYWRIDDTVNYIQERNFNKIALQFPDSLLSDATEVSLAVQDACMEAGLSVQVGISFITSSPFQNLI